ncbi:hypothetical protein C2G38_2030872 [Gigaspora rosea]|uniref:Uncharacterized protein n=1 Tax=Gigaspora rosea TaxID=44941 RepID=A0A397W044_9GLOM|nr:hypothetical protein C2G38_2030872 [Gigaspora rosea]
MEKSDVAGAYWVVVIQGSGIGTIERPDKSKKAYKQRYRPKNQKSQYENANVITVTTKYLLTSLITQTKTAKSLSASDTFTDESQKYDEHGAEEESRSHTEIRAIASQHDPSYEVPSVSSDFTTPPTNADIDVAKTIDSIPVTEDDRPEDATVDDAGKITSDESESPTAENVEKNDEFLNQYEKIYMLVLLETIKFLFKFFIRKSLEEQKNNEVLRQACLRVQFLLDSNTYNTAEEKERFKREIIQNDETLTQEEKDAMYLTFTSLHGRNERQCEFCKNFTENFEFCEHCIQNYLRGNFCNWTSGNKSTDKLIQLCQQNTLRPNSVIEWISFNQFKNVIYRTSGGFASIYTDI